MLSLKSRPSDLGYERCADPATASEVSSIMGEENSVAPTTPNGENGSTAGEAKFDMIPLKNRVIKAAFEEDILPADVDRKVAQGICTMVSPIVYSDDEDGEMEMLRTKFKRKLVGKMKGDVKVTRGGHVKDFDLEDGNRVTLVWFDDDKLIHELENTNYSMPLDIDSHYGAEEYGENPENVKVGSCLQLIK